VLILSELPVFVLVAPANYIGITSTLLAILVGCILSQKYHLYEKNPLEKRTLLPAIAIAVLMGISFINTWMPSSKVATIAGIVNLSAKTFLFIIGSLLTVASVWGVLNIITILKEIVARFSKNNTEVSDRSFYKWYTIILVLCTVLYGALLGGRYVWVDEAYTFAMVQHSYAEIWSITAADVHPPLYYFVLKFLTKPFEYSLISAKIVSILPYLFILSFGGIQFKNLFGKKNALLFMALFFLSPFSMGYAVEVRMYSFAAAFVFGNAVYAYRCYYEEKKSNWIIFAILGVCSAYTHYFALVSTGIVYGILLVLLLLKKRKKILPWCLSSLLTIILYLPWMKCFVEQLVYKVNNEYWISKITVRTLVGYVFSIFGSHTSATVAFLVALAYLLALVECFKSKNHAKIILSVCMIAVPVGTIAIGVLASVLVRPVFVIRYVVPAIPILVAFLIISTSRNNKSVRLYAIAVSVLAGIIGYTSIIQSEYSITENALDSTFIDQHSTAQCFVVTTETSHICGVLSYYEPTVPIYSGDSYWAASPYPNIYPVGEFDVSEYTDVVLLIDVGESPESKYQSNYHCEFIGKINECGNLADVYWLTK